MERKTAKLAQLVTSMTKMIPLQKCLLVMTRKVPTDSEDLMFPFLSCECQSACIQGGYVCFRWLLYYIPVKSYISRVIHVESLQVPYPMV